MQLAEKGKIKLLLNTNILSVSGNEVLEKVELINIKTQEKNMEIFHCKK